MYAMRLTSTEDYPLADCLLVSLPFLAVASVLALSELIVSLV